MGALFDNSNHTDWANKSKQELIEALEKLEHAYDELKEQSAKQQTTEKALQQEIDFTMKLIHSAPTFFVTLTPDGNTLMMNDTMLTTLGYASNDVVGRNCTSTFIAPGDSKILKDSLNVLTKEKIPHTFTLQTMAKNGEPYLIEWHCTPVLDMDKKLEYIFGIGIDITERKVAAQALSESVGRYQDLFDTSPDSITLVDIDGKIINCNHATEILIGYDKEEITNKYFYELLTIDPSVMGDLIDKHKALQKGKAPVPYELEIIRKNGEKRTIEVMTSFLKQEDTITGFQIIARDITERKENESRLKETEEKFRTIFDCANDAIFIHDMNWHFLEVNKTACERLGYSRDELLNMTPYDIDTPDFRLLAPERLKELEEKGQLFFETAHLTKNGKEIAVELSSRLIHFAGQQAILSVARDITERKRMQQSLEESEKKYRSLVDNAVVGVYKSTLDGKMLYVNEALATMFEFDSPADMIRQGALALYRNINDRTHFLKAIQESGSVKYFELELQTKQKHPLHVLVSAYLEGDILSGMIMDITKRKRMEEELKSNVDRLKQLMTNTVDSMASILETRDPYTAGHQQRVAQLAIAMAKEMNLSEDQLMGLNMAAVIHDIGKIYVPAEILTRPSALTDSEFALIKTHPKVGYEILKRVDFPWPVATIVLQHHERCNGTGYPQGLKGKSIILESRILAVADVVEAMSSHRPYRPARSMEETLLEIRSNKDMLYDAKAADVCLELFEHKGFSFNNE